MRAIEMLIASITSSKMDGIGTIKNTTAANRYNPTPISAFLNIIYPLLSLFVQILYLNGLLRFTDSLS